MGFISRLHTDLRQTRITHRGVTARAEDVPAGTYKTYPRMEKVELPKPAEILVPLGKTLHDRRSFSSCADGALTIDEWSTLLGNALQKHEGIRRHYPSGGGLYPIETYILANQISGSNLSGVFHYRPDHALEHLWPLPDSSALERCFPKPSSLSRASFVVFTSVWARSSSKYGDFTYLLAHQEAGHMSENILLCATAMKLGIRPLGGFDDARTKELLDLDDTEQAVLAIAIGRTSARNSSELPTIEED